MAISLLSQTDVCRSLNVDVIFGYIASSMLVCPLISTDHKKKAKKAMDMWSEHTCITFRKMKNSELKTTRIMDFVKIQYGNV